MPTAYIRVSKENTGKGMIKHSDRNVAGKALDFETVAVIDGDMVIKVTGPQAVLNKWASRVKGSVLNKNDVDSIVASLPLGEEEQMKADIEDLKKRVAKLEKGLGLGWR